MNTPFQAYENNAVNTASKGQLTLMLYDGCIKFIKQAIKYTEEKKYEEKNKHIQKAQAIIQELMLTLDQKAEISNQLMPLYEYINYQLQQGNIKNNPETLKEALEFVTDFRDTWKEVMKKAATTTYEQGAQV